MTKYHPLSAFPERVRSNAKTEASWYVRQRGLFAVHGSSAVPSGVEVVSFDDGAIVIQQGDPNDEEERRLSGKIGAVYALEPDGPPAVPTGRVFVRLREGLRVEEQRPEIELAGYVIESIPEYAPHAAWLRHRSGEIVQSLRSIDALETLRDVESIEPQMLMAAMRR